MKVIKFTNLFLITAKLSNVHEIPLCIGKYHIDDLTPNIGHKVNIKSHTYSKLVHTNFDKLPDTIKMHNNGETAIFQFIYDNLTQIPTISEGPLEGQGIYQLEFLYFNWLNYFPSDWKPSDMYLSAELHIVFFSNKINNIESAVEENNGIAIMSFRFEKTSPRNESENYRFELLVSSLKYIRKDFTTNELDKSQAFSLNDILPSKSVQFQYTYTGTMIRGYCTPDVIWMDYEDKLPITDEEIYEFNQLRGLYDVQLTTVKQHYTQPRGVVYRNCSVRSLLALNTICIALVLTCMILINIY